nr:MAG TPA: hypothetical protein [Caudoviricetes sp.]
MHSRSILSLSCWPRFLGVEAFSFKRNLSVPERLIPLSKIYNCCRLSIPIPLYRKLTEIVNL